MLIPSSKTGADKYDLGSIDANKVYPRIDARLLGENIKNLSEQTLGYSLSGNEGSSQAQVPLLSVIDTANIATYNKLLPQFISTLISNGNLLDVDGASTANSIILNPHNISPGLSPNGTDYSQAASLPFAYKDGLSFSFRATITNTAGIVLNIPLLAGAGGALEVLTDQEIPLPSGTIIANKYYTIVCKTIATVKKYILKQGDSVIQASQLEVNAGVVTNKFVAPSTLAGLFNNSSRLATGYARYLVKEGGIMVEMIEQWGSISLGSAVSTPIVLPIAYPNAHRVALATWNSTDAGLNEPPLAQRTSNSTITVTNAGPVTAVANWFSKGY